MFKSILGSCLSWLLASTLLAACQSDPPKTEQEAVKKEAVVISDSATAAKPDSVVR